ncbi:hypothetical protein ACSBR2_004647 [Camellia fascicularis]
MIYFCRDIMESRRSTEVPILFKAVLNEILEKSNLKLAIHSIQNIGRNHKPAFIASVEIKDGDKKKKFYGTENSTKKGAEKEVAMMVIKHLNDQSESANVKADHEKLREDYEKLLAENEELKKQLKNAITPSEKSTDMLSEDLNTDFPRTTASVSSFFSDGEISIANNTNSYKATMNCDMSTFCHLLPNNDNVHYWYKFALEHKSSHLLRILGKARVGDDQIILFSQPVDQNFEDWMQHNLLINQDNHLTPSFTALLLDMLKGINYFHGELKHAHGEICGKNIYVIDGRAKFANVVDIDFKKSYIDDINSFCKMVKSPFEAKNIPLPLELKYLLSSLKKPNGLCNSVNHPVLLNSYGRAMYRHMALRETRHMKNYGNFNQDMIAAYPKEKNKNRNLNFSWIKKVMDGKKSYSSVLYYDPSKKDGQGQQIQYNNSPEKFLRFSRNIQQHVDVKISIHY